MRDVVTPVCGSQCERKIRKAIGRRVKYTGLYSLFVSCVKRARIKSVLGVRRFVVRKTVSGQIENVIRSTAGELLG